MRIRPRCGICWATSNALTHGPPRTRLGYRFFLAWCVTMKPLQARYNMLSASDLTAVWDLLGDEQRPYTWTSADAAGLPIFPGLVRYDETAAGKIQHAFRFTLPKTSAAFTPPASHWAATSSDPTAPPMGMRLRLKSSYDISGFSTQMQVILTAMKTYGLILADNGSALY